MSLWTVEVAPRDDGARVDAFLARCGESSRSAFARLCAENRVTRNGKPLDKNDRVSVGDVVTVDFPPAVPDRAAPQELPLSVVFEDAHLIVVDKPRGLVVHPSAGHADGTLVNALLHHCGGSLSGIGGVVRPGIVHRIDKDTSGLLVAAKTDRAHAGLSAQLKEHNVLRAYEALVRGRLPAASGLIDAPVGRDPKNRKRMAVLASGGKPAITRYTVLAEYPGYTHVACELETGRTHQIRVHMKHLGHPVAGDPLYGGVTLSGIDGQCLHAKTLRFSHPITGEALTFRAPLPADFTGVLRRLTQE